MRKSFAISAMLVLFPLAGCGGKPENSMITDREQIEWLKNADKMTAQQEAEALEESMMPTPR